MTIAAVFLTGHDPLAAQAMRTLAEPIATLSQGFTRVAGVRELSDGKVVLVDSDERRVVLVSADLASVKQVGRTGEGPGEYRLPSRLLALGGDSTAVLDAVNARLLLINADGTTGDMVDLRYAAPGSKSILPPPVTSDAHGRLFTQASPIAERSGKRVVIDSAAILRWLPGAAPDTAAFVHVDASRYHVQGSFVSATPMGPFAAFAQWAVGVDGRVGIVYPEPYHVAIHPPDGPSRTGEVIDDRPIRVTARQKESYRREAEKPRPVLVGRVGAAPTVTMVSRPFTEPEKWPEFLPPFRVNAFVAFTPDGDLWVERNVETPEDGASCDVFDGSGRRIGRVSLPAGRSIVGLSEQFVYLVRRDDVDLLYLERYRRPRLLR